MYDSGLTSDTVDILPPHFAQMCLNYCIAVITFLFNECCSSAMVFKAEQHIVSCIFYGGYSLM